MSYKLRIILEYFQPKIGRRIRIFNLGRKNNILIKKKKSVRGKYSNCHISTRSLLESKYEFLPLNYSYKLGLIKTFRTRVVYKFSSASCNACYVGETSRHFSRPHLQSSESCRTSWRLDCFQMLDSAATKYQVKLKKSICS